MKIHQSMWIQWPFFCKTRTKGRWPPDGLWPCLLRSHVWLYPRIIVSKSDENASKYVDTVILFSKTWIKGHWLLDHFAPVRFWPDIMLLEQDGYWNPHTAAINIPIYFLTSIFSHYFKKRIEMFFKNRGQQRDSNHRPIDHESSPITSTPARVLCRNITFYPAWTFTE